LFIASRQRARGVDALTVIDARGTTIAGAGEIDAHGARPAI
jgi:hypothetical protein